MKYKIIFLLIVMFLLNGLNNARELNELSIVSAIGIDLDDDGNYIITSQILNTKKENSSGSGSGSSSGSSEIVIFNSTSNNIQTALRNTIEESPRKLYLAHMELLLISEKVAQEKEILDTLNFFIRDNEGSNDFMLVITKDTTPQEVLKISTPLESNPAQNIKDSILTTHKYKSTATDNILSDNITMFKKEDQASVLTSIQIDNKGNNSNNSEDENSEKNSTQESALEETSNKEKSNSSEEQPIIKVASLGYFKKKTLSGYLTEEESYLYNIIMNKSSAGIIEIGENKYLLVVEEFSANAKLDPKVENDNYYIDISIKMNCNITETGENIRFDTDEEMQKYQLLVSEHLKEKIITFIDKTKEEYDCDLFGFGTLFYKYKNKDYNILKAKYGEDYYKHINTNINVDITFPSRGGISNTW